jgi:hypothetical protein
MTEAKIQLKAWFDEAADLHITDQDGREFEFVPEYQARYGRADKPVQIQVELEAPHWPDDARPYVNVTFRVPAEVRSKAVKDLVESMRR